MARRRVPRSAFVLAAAALTLGPAVVLALHFEAFATRHWPKDYVSRTKLTEDGAFLVVEESLGIEPRRTRLLLFELANPLDRWLGARRALELNRLEDLELAPAPDRVVVREPGGTPRLVSFDPGAAPTPPLWAGERAYVVDLRAGSDVCLVCEYPTGRRDDGASETYSTRSLARLTETLARCEGFGLLTPDASSVAVVSTRGVDLIDARTGRLRLALETREGTPASRLALAPDGALWVQPVAATRSPQFLAAQESAAWRQPTSLGGEAASRVEVFSLDTGTRTDEIALDPGERLVGPVGSGESLVVWFANRYALRSRCPGGGASRRFLGRDDDPAFGPGGPWLAWQSDWKLRIESVR